MVHMWECTREQPAVLQRGLNPPTTAGVHGLFWMTFTDQTFQRYNKGISSLLPGLKAIQLREAYTPVCMRCVLRTPSRSLKPLNVQTFVFAFSYTFIYDKACKWGIVRDQEINNTIAKRHLISKTASKWLWGGIRPLQPGVLDKGRIQDNETSCYSEYCATENLWTA